MEQRPIVTTFPSSDGAFRRAVERASGDATHPVKDELARRLQPMFPRVAVFERQLTGEPPQLYVFRDGHFSADHDDRWWDADGVACVCLSATTGRLTQVSPEYASIMGADPADLLGRHFLEFVQPAAVDAAEAMFDALSNDREVITEAVLRRVDGTPLRIQLHAARKDGEIDVRYRPIPGTANAS
ncbi:MAG TPA: PAS domain-containing protein [Candidatus Limnocylindrales bacterium]|nr:PAS domain-containing protein [Candidatus Limnocylindrales bacterium]